MLPCRVGETSDPLKIIRNLSPLSHSLEYFRSCANSIVHILGGSGKSFFATTNVTVCCGFLLEEEKFLLKAKNTPLRTMKIMVRNKHQEDSTNG